MGAVDRATSRARDRYAVMRASRPVLTFAALGAVTSLLVPASPAGATHPPSRGADYLLSGLTLKGTGINGSSRKLSGSIRIQTPRAWPHLNRNGSRSQYFRAVTRTECTAGIHVSPRASATRQTAQEQVDRAMRFRVGPLLGRGRLAGGARWALAVHHDPTGDEDAPAPAVHRTLYGITVTPIARRRFVHTRVWVTLSSRCTDDDVRTGSVQREVERLLRTARVRARIS